MATKIRLQRHGRKRYAFYPIVIADSRAPRDGKFIERIGSYNPNTNPATISLNFERALYWVSVGAQPTDTVRRLLSNEGVLLKKADSKRLEEEKAKNAAKAELVAKKKAEIAAAEAAKKAEEAAAAEAENAEATAEEAPAAE